MEKRNPFHGSSALIAISRTITTANRGIYLVTDLGFGLTNTGSITISRFPLAVFILQTIRIPVAGFIDRLMLQDNRNKFLCLDHVIVIRNDFFYTWFSIFFYKHLDAFRKSLNSLGYKMASTDLPDFFDRAYFDRGSTSGCLISQHGY
jgi:hypothetical protein